MTTSPKKRKFDDLSLSPDPPPLVDLSSHSAGEPATSSTSALLSAVEVNKLTENVKGHFDALVYCLSNEKSGEKKDKMRNALNAMSSAFASVCRSYLSLLASSNATDSCLKIINDACARLEKKCDDVVCNTQAPPRSFAEVAGRSLSRSYNKPTELADRVTLVKGKPFPINEAERVVIGPSEGASDSFKSSEEIKSALLRAIDPVKLKMRVKRVISGPNRAVIIEGENLNSASLAVCSSLVEAGLEVKPDEKLNPRLVIHDIPVELSDANIAQCVIEQNLTGASVNDIKIVYLYPPRNKKLRSCIIEVNPEHRRQLLSRGKVTINWSLCRIDDHVSILQCFKCLGFNHTASTCKKEVRCGKCAEEHDSKVCKSNSLKCVNCISSNYSNVSHSASDRAKCPILRRKVERKISFINYGCS